MTMYEDIGIRLSGVLSGMLVRKSGCFAVDPGDSAVPVRLILPRGTRWYGEGFKLPEANGGKAFHLGVQVALQGGYTEISNAPGDDLRDYRCKGDAFIVNHAENGPVD